MNPKRNRALVLAALFLFATADLLAQQGDSPPTALWVDGSGTGLQSLESIQEAIAAARGAGFDTVVAVVRSEGSAHYSSSFEPRAANIRPGLADPLATLIREARDPLDGEPLRVLVGINVLLVHRGASLPPRGHVSTTHPEWLLRSLGGERSVREGGVIHQFLDPGIIEVRQHTTAVVAELVRNYEFDGLVLDHLRYPEGGSQWGYTTMGLQQFHETVGEVGLPSADSEVWTRWRRNQITTLLREIAFESRRARPGLPIWVGAETSGSIANGFENSETYTEMFQDWPNWVADGLCDGLVIKNFHDGRRAEGAEVFEGWMSGSLDALGRHVDLMIAVSGRANYRSVLFRQMREVLAIGAETSAGLGLYDFDNAARDADDRIFAEIRRSVFQARSRQDLPELPDFTTTTVTPTGESAATPDIAETMMTPSPEIVTTAPVEELIDEAFTFDPSSPDEDFLEDLMLDEPEEMAASAPAEGFEPDPAFFLPPPVDQELLDVPLPGLGETSDVFDALPPAEIPRPDIRALLAPTGQDVVTLTSGRRIEGQIEEEMDQAIMIRLDSGSIVTIQRDRIDSVQHAEQ